MNTNEEILDYIDAAEHTGSLMLTGKWGCGKSYLVKNLVDELNKSNEYAICIISLFGINDGEELNKTIKYKFLELQCKLFNEKNNKKCNFINNFAKKTTEEIATLFPGNAIAAALASSVSIASSINLLDLINVSNTIKDEKKFVLIFDDFERKKIDTNELLGIINQYNENLEIKTIIVADTDKIDEDHYFKLYREKVIARTINIKQDYNKIIEAIIDDYKETTEGYVDFLKINIDIIYKAFSESCTNNLRILKNCLFHFERIYSIWSKTGVAEQYLQKVLYCFIAVYYEAKTQESITLDDYINISDDRFKKYSKIENWINVLPIRNWIVLGEWNESFFIDMIRSIFGTDNIKESQKMLYWNFWNLDDDVAKKGFEQILDLGYKGNLGPQELISFLHRMYEYQFNSMEIPCQIDYGKLIKGLEIRTRKVKSGYIIENLSDVTKIAKDELSKLSEEQKKLYKIIEKYIDKSEGYNKSIEIILYLNDSSNSDLNTLEKINIVSLDNNLEQKLRDSFIFADNEKKWKIGTIIKNIVVTDSMLSDDNDIAESKRNFENLKLELEEYKLRENDSFSNKIIDSTIRAINTQIEKIKKYILDI